MLSVPGQENPFISTNIDAGPMKRKAGPEFFRGIDVEIMSEVAQALGVRLEIVPAVGEGGIPTYSALIPALLAGEGDIIASAFSITPARTEKISFSTPYFHNEVVVIMRSDAKVSQAQGLAGLKAGVVPKSSLDDYLRDLNLEGLQRLEVEMQLEAYEAVSEGNADFLLDDLSAGLGRFLDLFDNLNPAFSLPVEDLYAFGLRPGSDLLEPINRALKKLRRSGRLREIVALDRSTIED